MEKVLIKVLPDERGTKYKYSEDLFNYFYNNLKYYSMITDEWLSLDDFDAERTKQDHEGGGCRIWFKKLEYIKLYEVDFLIEYDLTDLSDLYASCEDEVKLSDVVNFYYKKRK